MPGQTRLAAMWHGREPPVLQWRAGHVPGQTRPGSPQSPQSYTPSMEGRARARPNTTAASPPPGDQPPFNGGPGTCPAKPGRRDGARAHRRRPSMEGRARARPNPAAAFWAVSRNSLQWRAGHVPGQTRRRRPSEAVSRNALQWRAGHVPGQTRRSSGYRGPPHGLQWRAGHVPGQTSTAPPAPTSPTSFNGGPGTCPAKPATSPDAYGPTSSSLQWRAGHVPGQTPGAAGAFDAEVHPFNGGPGTCPAKPLACFGGYDLLVRGHLRAV